MDSTLGLLSLVVWLILVVLGEGKIAVVSSLSKQENLEFDELKIMNNRPIKTIH
ncbi:hypothetical protein MKX03_005948, partial [Papaver bracteatum]